MALLGNNQRRQIRDAIKLVTDTFMVTPILYHFAGSRFDRWNEDQTEQSYFSIELNALVEYGQTLELKPNLQGTEDNLDIKLTFNLEDLESKNLITSDFKWKGNQTKDYFSVKGQLYRISDLYYDGPLDSKDVLLIVEGIISKDSNVEFNQIVNDGTEIPLSEVVSRQIIQEETSFEVDDNGDFIVNSSIPINVNENGDLEI